MLCLLVVDQLFVMTGSISVVTVCVFSIFTRTLLRRIRSLLSSLNFFLYSSVISGFCLYFPDLKFFSRLQSFLIAHDAFFCYLPHWKLFGFRLARPRRFRCRSFSLESSACSGVNLPRCCLFLSFAFCLRRSVEAERRSSS